MNSAEPENIESVESMLIDISTLRAANGGFAESNKLGEGGFGSVYKVLMTKHKLRSHTYTFDFYSNMDRVHHCDAEAGLVFLSLSL
jgi:hypothetical protein